uniref:Uncharacterized protein n=1 Tax=Paramormyrops kingsleyae TaxID=1676925 RepID=A0A3B3SQ09_9TELE
CTVYYNFDYLFLEVWEGVLILVLEVGTQLICHAVVVVPICDPAKSRQSPPGDFAVGILVLRRNVARLGPAATLGAESGSSPRGHAGRTFQEVCCISF